MGLLLFGCDGDLANLWARPDQRGARLLDAGRFDDAADRFEDPMWRGVALFRAGEFEDAAAAFGRIASPEAAFNRGNALVMLGRYDDAIESYDRALALREEWPEAEVNRGIAVARRDRMKPPEDDAGGTGGKLGADEIVFDDRAKNSSNKEVEVGEGEKLGDEELRALWLRKVKTRPRDFLRVKFAYQKAMASRDEEESR